MSDCIFCQIIKKEIPATTVYEDDQYLVILDLFPATQGQTLVIPKEHSSYLFAADDDTYQNIMLFSKKMVNILDKTFEPVRTCLVVEGFHVDHVHIKLYPCFQAHLPQHLTGPQAAPEELAKNAERIKANLE